MCSTNLARNGRHRSCRRVAEMQNLDVGTIESRLLTKSQAETRAARLTRIWSVAFGVALIAGCAVGPNYHRPALDVPESFRNARPAAATNSLAQQAWTNLFPDPNLQGL